ncbi:RecBCD enzyme subunit RecB [Betaproteobacteria bacterium]|nr:RecBCD enzyme subunit RecB [Betaproteobacteria bacterium]
MSEAPLPLDVLTVPLDGVRLIEASAGTGKTYSIRGLYLRQVLERDVAVGQLLVVTFTKAATAELAERIRKSLVDARRACDAGPGAAAGLEGQLVEQARVAGKTVVEIRQRLNDAIARFDEAAIFTIHGFCQRALADSPFAAGQPYRLELGEDDGVLRLEVARDFWRRELSGPDSGGNAQLAAHLLAHKDSPERWAMWLKEMLARPLAREEWDVACEAAGEEGAALEAALAMAWEEACQRWGDGEAVRAALEKAQPGLSGVTHRKASVDLALDQWKAWMRFGDAHAPVPDKKDSKLHLLAASRLTITKTGEKSGIAPPEHPFFAAAEAVLDARAAVDEALESARLRLLRRFIAWGRDSLRERKWAARSVAFDDILTNTWQALRDQPWLGAALHQRYPVALIDEFQDTDPLQWEIFQRIYVHADEGRHGSLFLVGDPKQAIYSFRGADLHTYLAARAQADSRYALDTNHRSTPAQVSACNSLFLTNRRVFMEAGLDYVKVNSVEPATALIDATASGHSPAALRLWRIPPDEGGAGGQGGERWARGEAKARAGAATAAEIARLLNAGQRGEIRLGERGLAPSDIAVLVYSHAEGKDVRAALAVRGVGSVELAQASVYASLDAEELERVLRAIDDPSRERRVKTALATELMGWDAAALERLAGDDNRLFAEIERFAAWREQWQRHGFIVMLRRWMADDGVAARLLGRDDGERRLTNLLHLAELLQQEAGDNAPAAVLASLARHRREGDGGEAAQLRLESDRNLVKIVTIHRAKGLEYGIVFCPFLFDAYSRSRESGPLRFWHDTSAAQQVADWRRSQDASKDEVAKSQRAERHAETLRLIYVALTRAKYRAYLVVGAYRNGKDSYNESGRSLLNWMVAGDGVEPTQWKETKEWTPAGIDVHWRTLVSRSAGMITLDDLPTATGESIEVSAVPTKFSAARPPKVAHGWWLGSFSALVSGAEHEAAARDHDARIDGASATEGNAAVTANDDILLFPRGASAGDCIHAVFEHTDFTRPDTRARAIAHALTAHPQPGAHDAGGLADRLARMVDDVLTTPLLAEDAGFTLATLPWERRLTELGFYLPAPHLSADALNRWLAAHGYATPRLTFGALDGYLKGYIDLVFEHAGRFWVLDWKSNHLGDTPAAYAVPALEAAMAQHGYHLQHLLYTVALHRHLGLSVENYDYARHFGGVLYLFVRGVRPTWQLEGVPTGVFHHRADPAVIEALDRLLRAMDK